MTQMDPSMQMVQRIQASLSYDPSNSGPMSTGYPLPPNSLLPVSHLADYAKNGLPQGLVMVPVVPQQLQLQKVKKIAGETRSAKDPTKLWCSNGQWCPALNFVTGGKTCTKHLTVRTPKEARL